MKYKIYIYATIIHMINIYETTFRATRILNADFISKKNTSTSS